MLQIMTTEMKARRKPLSFSTTMRNPDRIPEILKELEEFWRQVPDWRLGQVISNLNYEITGNNDSFYLEDKDLLELLQQKNRKS